MKLHLKSTVFSESWSSALFGLGTVMGWAALSFIPSHAAFASDVPSAQTLDALRSSGALNSIFCEPDCGRFFEDGQAAFEEEIRRLEERGAHLNESDTLLRIDPDLRAQLDM